MLDYATRLVYQQGHLSPRVTLAVQSCSVLSGRGVLEHTLLLLAIGRLRGNGNGPVWSEGQVNTAECGSAGTPNEIIYERPWQVGRPALVTGGRLPVSVGGAMPANVVSCQHSSVPCSLARNAIWNASFSCILFLSASSSHMWQIYISRSWHQKPSHSDTYFLYVFKWHNNVEFLG